jgi:hypothetical protein
MNGESSSDVAIVELIASGGFAVCQDNRRGFGFGRLGKSNLDCKHDRFLQKHSRRHRAVKTFQVISRACESWLVP